VTCGSDKTVRVWDAAAGTELRKLAGHKGAVYALAFTPGGRLLTSGADKTVRVWDLTSDAERRSLPEHRGEVYAVAISPDGSRCVTGGKDRAILLWRGGNAIASRE
jgi:WD40 repeat protein